MIHIALQKHDGSLLALGDGCWCVFSGRVYFRCPECAGLYTARIADVAADGAVKFDGWDGGLFRCQDATCGYARFVSLAGWTPPQPFDLGGLS